MTGPRAALWIAVVAMVGCGAAPSPAQVHRSPSAVGSTRPPWLADDDDPTVARMRALAGRLRRAGVSPGALGGRGFLAAQDHHIEPLLVPARRCFTLVALGSPGVRDLDAMLYAPRGDVLAEDVEDDAHPTVQACAGARPRRLYYVLRAYAGAGVYVFASFVGARGSLAAVRRVVGGRPGVAGSPNTSHPLDARLAELRGRLGRRGFERLGEVAVFPLERDQHVRVPLPVQEGHCYSVAAFGGEGGGGVRLRVLDELGQPLSTASVSEGVTQLCMDRDADLAVDVWSGEAQREVRVDEYVADVARVGGSSGLWLGRRRDQTYSEEAPDVRIEALSRRARREGWGRLTPRASGRLAPGQALTRDVRLAGGTCTRLVLAGGRGMGTLRIRLVGPAGEDLGSRRGEGGMVQMTACVERPVSARVQIVAERGAGAWTLAVTTRRPPAWLSAVPTGVRGDLVDPPRMGAGVVLAPAAGVDPVRRVSLVEGEDAPVDLPQRVGCYAILAVAGGRGGAISARLVRGGRVRARRFGRRVTLQACTGQGNDPTRALLRGVGAEDAAWVRILEHTAERSDR